MKVGVVLVALVTVCVCQTHSFKSCFRWSTTVQQLNGCLEQYFPKKDTLQPEQWQRMLPTPAEATSYRKLVQRVLKLKSFRDCKKSLLRRHTAIADYVQVRRFRNRFCVIGERRVDPGTGYFARSWGYVVVTSPSSSRRHLHHSSPHFLSDGNIHNETAWIFEATASRTFVAAGASRFAVPHSRSTCQKYFRAADAAHEKRTMFHQTNVAVWQTCEQQKDPCVFVQWHGMAPTTCTESVAYLSCGAGNHSHVYLRAKAPVVKITTEFNKLGRSVARTPLTYKCGLVARSNIFGRLLNGVPEANVCHTQAIRASGDFVHIEQHRPGQPELRLARWALTLNNVFAPQNVFRIPRTSRRSNSS